MLQSAPRPLFAGLAALSCLVSGEVLAQAPAAGPGEEAVRQAFGGYWENVAPVIPGEFEKREQPLTPPYQDRKVAIRKQRAAGVAIESGDNSCIPSGMPRTMLFGPFEVIVRHTGLGLFTAGGGLQVRNIWTDGRRHTPAADLFDTFGGESIGHWEGDVLVVDTTGLRTSNEFVYGIRRHAMHVVERFRKTGPDALEVVTTVEDPAVFTTPWVYTTNYRRRFDKALDELNYCTAGLYRGMTKDGKEGFDLTPPPDESGGR